MDEIDPTRPARRAASDDLPTVPTPVSTSLGGARRSLTPDWDEDDDWDDDADADADSDAASDSADTDAQADAGEHADAPVTTQAPEVPRAAIAEPAAQASPPRDERPVAPGSRPDDEWYGVPLPASAVPPPPVGSAPAPIALTTVAPDSHDAFRPPADDADTVVIKRGDLRAALAAADPGSPDGSAPADAPTPPALATPAWRPTSAPRTSPSAGTAQGAADGDATTTSAWTPARSTGEPAPGTALPTAPAPESPQPVTRLTASERLAAMRGRGNGAGPQPPRPAGRPRWLIPVAAIAVAALVIVLAVSWLGGRTSGAGSSPAPTPTIRTSTTAVLSEADLLGVADAALAIAADWTVQSTVSPVTADTPAPLCLAQVPTTPVPAASYQRTLAAGPAGVVHLAEVYQTAGDATAVMSLRRAQLGRCANIPVFLSSGATLTGLADDAVAVTAVIQDPVPVHHTVVLVRTGTVIDVIDVSQPSTAIGFEKAMSATAAVVGRQCPRSQGACPTTSSVQVGPPPSGGIAGWLTVSDLPRVNPGFGRWTANEPTTTIRIVNSQCENVTFASAPGPTQRRQRTYLLTEDNVPKGFGVDEVVLDFDSPDAAAAFSKSIVDNVEACPSRIPSAKLGGGSPFSGTGASGESISGYWRTVTLPTSASSVATFRIVVAVAGKRVVYVLLTPSGSFDLSDESWAAVGLRAAQRSTQQA